MIELPGMTLLPGLIDAHTHVLLHPYNEATWDDQVLKEPYALRVCRATNHLRAMLQSGFTTMRDLGTEGAGNADVGLKQAVEQGIIPGPRMLVSTRAIVATRSYAPRGFAPELPIPQGAEEADGETLLQVVRDQIGAGPTGSRSTPTPGTRRSASRLFAGGIETDRGDGATGRLSGGGPRDDEGRACGERRWRASRPSSTATAATSRCSG